MGVKMGQKMFSFTKTALTNLSPPARNEQRKIYRDQSQRGLLIMLTYGGSKTFYYCYKIAGRKKMIKIGQFPYIEINEAREKAFEYHKAIQHGESPTTIKPAQPATMLKSFFFNEYMPKYATQYKKPQTCDANIQMFNKHFSGIGDRDIKSFSKFEIDTLHKEIGMSRGQYAANRCLCLIRHIFNVAIDWGVIDTNPASKIRAYPEKSRDRFLQPDEMAKFMKALDSAKDKQLKNFILLLLYTGQRKMNICSLKWSYIDFHNNTLYLPETKNGEPQRIPLTNQAVELLKNIESERIGGNDYIFPSRFNKGNHIKSPKGFWNNILKTAGIENLRMHDLRRTMGSYQAITGSSMNIIAKSLGHKSVQSTSVYARLDLNSVRNSMQKATDEIQNCIKDS